MRGVAAILAATGLLAGCASSTVSLYADAEGPTGAVAVFDPATEDEVGALTEANTWTAVGGKSLKPQPIKAPHTDLMARMPPPPRGYVLYFSEGTIELTAESEPVLSALRLAVTPATDVQIVGHTDTVGSSADNDALSRDRAVEIRAALLKQGLPVQDAKVAGRGERELRIPTGDGVSEPGNRRVEVILR